MPEFTNFSALHKLFHSNWIWPITLTASASLFGFLFFVDIQIPLRPLLALWFLLICPGMALVRIFNVQNTLLEWVLAIALSISLSGIVSNIQIYTKTWSPAITTWLLIGITMGGVLIQSLLNLKLIAWPTSSISITLKDRKSGRKK